MLKSDQDGHLGSILATLGRNLLPTWPSSWLILLLRFSENFKQITHRTPKRAPRPPKTPQTMIFIDFGAPRTPPDYDFLRFGFKVFEIFYPSRLRFFTDVDGTFCSMLCCRFRQESHETPSKLPKWPQNDFKMIKNKLKMNTQIEVRFRSLWTLMLLNLKISNPPRKQTLEHANLVSVSC